MNTKKANQKAVVKDVVNTFDTIDTHIRTISIDKDAVSRYKGDPSFMRMIKRNRGRWIKALYNAVSSVPPSMNRADNRMQIGALMNAGICNEFQSFEPVVDHPYDLIYKNRRDGDCKISIKTGKSRVFQVPLKNGNLTRPADIIVKTFYSDNTLLANNEWDYLLFVQQQSLKKDIPFGFGIISFKSLLKIKSFSMDNTVLRYKIENSDWDYLYVAPTLLKPKNNKRLDYLYQTYLKMMYNGLLADLCMEIPQERLENHIKSVRHSKRKILCTNV